MKRKWWVTYIVEHSDPEQARRTVEVFAPTAWHANFDAVRKHHINSKQVVKIVEVTHESAETA